MVKVNLFFFGIDSVRILFATWWMYVILVTSLYSANLTAFITMNTFTLPIRKPIDIKEKGYKWTAESNGIFEYLNLEVIKVKFKK